MGSLQRQKVILFIGVILLFFALLYRLLPLAKEFLSETDRSFTEQRIEKLQKKSMKKLVLQQRHAILEKQLIQKESYLLQGMTPALAAVELQNILHDLARQYGVTVQSVRVLDPVKNENDLLLMYTTIAIEARMTQSVRQLKDILYGLAKSKGLLNVDVLTLQRDKKSKEGNIGTVLRLTGIMLES